MIASGQTESLCQRREPKNLRRETTKQQKMIWLICAFSAKHLMHVLIYIKLIADRSVMTPNSEGHNKLKKL